ncbi:hypothetical protein XELAEV_18002910mg [Xenopus laevis]|uniref:Uncharacterized protein n=1 Tax=Xenopus laevis TaxID=8355 RepID=A0A974BPY8_XENLA|nr:hypothetical protein XELAEV_18002910mg [Xenopus laevis]
MTSLPISSNSTSCFMVVSVWRISLQIRQLRVRMKENCSLPMYNLDDAPDPVAKDQVVRESDLLLTSMDHGDAKLNGQLEASFPGCFRHG